MNKIDIDDINYPRKPKLQFRYLIEFPEIEEFKQISYSGMAVKMPKWTIDNGWKNVVSINMYNFQLPYDLETILIKLTRNPLNIKFKINILSPREYILGYWDILGNIEIVDFNELTWAKDDVHIVTLNLMPIECEYVNLEKNGGE